MSFPFYGIAKTDSAFWGEDELFVIVDYVIDEIHHRFAGLIDFHERCYPIVALEERIG